MVRKGQQDLRDPRVIPATQDLRASRDQRVIPAT